MNHSQDFLKRNNLSQSEIKRQLIRARKEKRRERVWLVVTCILAIIVLGYFGGQTIHGYMTHKSH